MHIFRPTLLFCFLLGLTRSSWAQKAAETVPESGSQSIDFASSASLAAILFKVIGGLILVVGIMFILVIWLKKMGLTKGALHQGKLIQLIDSKMIAPKKYVAVVQVGSDVLALGVSDQQITMLHHLESGEKKITVPGDKNIKETAFSGILGRATGKFKDVM